MENPKGCDGVGRSLLEAAEELEAEAQYRIGLAKRGQASFVDLGAAAEGVGARRLQAKAAALRERAGASA